MQLPNKYNYPKDKPDWQLGYTLSSVLKKWTLQDKCLRRYKEVEKSYAQRFYKNKLAMNTWRQKKQIGTNIPVLHESHFLDKF
jgi:hypothetical protein